VGIRQFLDIGTGLPSHDNTHEVAQRVAPESRIVYVDNDPLVLAHAEALLTSNPNGATDYINADLNDPATIVDIAATKLDFTQPVAIMLMGILGHVPITDEDDQAANSIVARLKAELPSGGYLAIYDGTNTDPAYVEAIRLYNEGGSVPYHLRSPDQGGRFFDGLELVDPGAVQIQQWRPDNPDPFGSLTEVDAWGGVAKKR
jgi:S-adenosyl methyltransferase